MKEGDKVKVKNNWPEQWFFGAKPEILNLTVRKVFSNGKFSATSDEKSLRKVLHYHTAEVLV